MANGATSNFKSFLPGPTALTAFGLLAPRREELQQKFQQTDKFNQFQQSGAPEAIDAFKRQVSLLYGLNPEVPLLPQLKTYGQEKFQQSPGPEQVNLLKQQFALKYGFDPNAPLKPQIGSFVRGNFQQSPGPGYINSLKGPFALKYGFDPNAPLLPQLKTFGQDKTTQLMQILRDTFGL